MVCSTPADRARELADLARENPSSVDQAELRELLGAESAEARWYALQAFRTAAGSAELDLSAHVEPLSAALEHPDSRVQSTAAFAIGDVAAREPAAVTDRVEAMTELLAADRHLIRTAVSDFLCRVAAAAADPASDVEPEALEPAVPALRGLLEDTSQRENAVLALGRVADRYADRLTGDVDAFRDVFLTSSEGPNGIEMDGPTTHASREQVRESTANATIRQRAVRTAAGEALVAIARDHPDAVVDSVPALADALDDPDSDVRIVVLELFAAVATDHSPALESSLDSVAARLDDTTGVCEHAVLALAAASQSDPDAVVDSIRPYRETVVDLVGHESAAVRGAAAGLLSFVAERSPDAVDSETVRPLLDDDHACVRGNGVWILRYLDADTARDPLRELAASDPDPEVRSAAEAALDCR